MPTERSSKNNVRSGGRFMGALERAALRRASWTLATGLAKQAAEFSSEPSWSISAHIDVGLKGTAQLLVGPEHTASFVGSGRIAVLATPVMINLIEAAALKAVEHLLPAGHQSLGIHLDVGHVAATPVGLQVTATAEVVRVEGRTISFRVEARDEVEVIGGGHPPAGRGQRGRFDERVQRKVRAET